MAELETGQRTSIFCILAVTQDQWGERISAHIQNNAPEDWRVETWKAPHFLPPIIDDPEDFLPPTLPKADLVLALCAIPGLAQLVPDIARLTGARAVIAPIDNNAALPTGLARQLRVWLEEIGVTSAFPKPFCSLTPTSINRTPLKEEVTQPEIQRFAEIFGKPAFRIEVNDGQISHVEVLRDAACGCASYTAAGLLGKSVEDAAEAAGLLHHHFPCLASMEKDSDYRDTLMHVSGNFLKDAVQDEMRPYITYLKPEGLSDPDGDDE